MTKQDTAPQEADACGTFHRMLNHKPRMMIARDRCHTYMHIAVSPEAERQTSDSVEKPLVRSLLPFEAEYANQVLLDGKKERGTAGDNRTSEGILQVSFESQLKMLVWKDFEERGDAGRLSRLPGGAHPGA